MEVIVYTKTTCMPCKMVKRFLTDKGATLIEKNIEENEEFINELKEAGFSSTPVSLPSNGDFSKAVKGFDIPKLEMLIGIKTK